MIFAYTLAHYFFPSHTNNHKAKLLHTWSLFAFSVFLVVYQLILQALPITGLNVLGYAANISPDEIVRLTNQKRADTGVTSLTVNPALTQAAKVKGEHMLQYDYWAHVAPDGTEPWKFFTDFGYKYRYAGENLARDFSNPNDAIEAWMASSSHRDNMLSGKYKEIGIAVVEGDLAGVDTTIIVQLFGTALVDTTPQVPIAAAKPQTEITLTPIPTKIPLTPSTTPVPSETFAPIIVAISPIPTQPILISLPEPVQKKNEFEILISPFTTTRGISIATTVVLLGVMAIDGIVVFRKKIPRIGGRTLAHIAFLGMILAILLIAKAGKIL